MPFKPEGGGQIKERLINLTGVIPARSKIVPENPGCATIILTTELHNYLS